MTEYVWTEVRDEAVRAFDGEQPERSSEDEVFAVFMRSPVAVKEAIGRVAARKRSGKITSGWAILRLVARELDAASAGSGPTGVASDEGERQRKVDAATRWMDNAGLLFDKQDELEDELFGDHGRLRMWSHDAALREMMVSLWRSKRPDGEKIEAEELERAEAWKVRFPDRRWTLEPDAL